MMRPFDSALDSRASLRVSESGKNSPTLRYLMRGLDLPGPVQEKIYEETTRVFFLWIPSAGFPTGARDCPPNGKRECPEFPWLCLLFHPLTRKALFEAEQKKLQKRFRHNERLTRVRLVEFFEIIRAGRRMRGDRQGKSSWQGEGRIFC